MDYMKAEKKHMEAVYQLVQETIKTIYPKYYPKEVVSFFCSLHDRKAICGDIEKGRTGILLTDDQQLLGTGSRQGNHITRVYVAPAYQGRGYGSHIMECLEKEIGKQYGVVRLDASLPACCMYEHRGYQTVEHKIQAVGNSAVLVYEIMEKKLSKQPGSQKETWGPKAAKQELIGNLGRLHTTELGATRIRSNLSLAAEEDVVGWCKDKITAPGTAVSRKGKNWYAQTEGCIITVNARSCTIITAHRRR